MNWIPDVFGNSVAIADFAEPTRELRIESVLDLERYAFERPQFELEPEARSYPFIYSPEDRIDLGRMIEPHYPDPRDELHQWARGFVASRPTDTLALLMDLNSGIRASFAYLARDEEGTQTPLETLRRGSGSCRDFALLLIEAARSLGFGARFVSGYLYDPALDGGANAAVQGAGATHAWADIYLPGAGWVEFDPTNGVIGAENLIRVAVTRDPAQAIPISGTYSGPPDAYEGMEVEVEVTLAG
jgi:transglutaminase-like putative cysteine protease